MKKLLLFLASLFCCASLFAQAGPPITVGPGGVRIPIYAPFASSSVTVAQIGGTSTAYSVYTSSGALLANELAGAAYTFYPPPGQSYPQGQTVGLISIVAGTSTFRASSSTIGSGSLLVARVPISSAQISTWLSVPVLLLPPPGPGKFIRLIAATLDYTPGTVGFTESVANDVEIVYSVPGSPFLALASSLGLIDQSSLISPGSFQLITVPWVNPGDNNTTITKDIGGNAGLLLQGGADQVGGGVGSTSLSTGGGGYAANDQVTINGGLGNAAITINTVDGGGAVLTYTVTFFGSGYSVTSGAATTNVVGTGAAFKVNIDSIIGPNGTLKAVLAYTIEDL